MKRSPEIATLFVALALALALALVVSCERPAGEPAAEPAIDGAGVASLSAGGDVSFASFSHTCAVVEGALQCWGANGFGQLGDRTPSVRSPLPVRVSGLPEPVAAVAAGGAHTCALAEAAVWCWGKNTARQLGSDRSSLEVVPARVPALPAPVSAVASGGQHGCAVAAGEVWCWGRGGAGELGHLPSGRCQGVYGALPCAPTPGRVEGLPAGVDEIALGEGHGCARLAGEVRCWGRGDRGQLGHTEAGPQAGPAVDLPGPAIALAAGGQHSCAVAAGGVFCWGANESGQLGDGRREDRTRPERVSGLSGVVSAIAAGRAHSCAVAGGRVFCWGANDEGQTGGDAESSATPVRVAELGSPVTLIAAGTDHSCAAVAGAQVRCWGDNDYGQLGSGDAPADHAGPASVAAWDRGRIRDLDGDGQLSVSCLGDSNTDVKLAGPRSWCERAQDRLGPDWSTVNRAQGGAGAVASSLRPARQQLGYTLENDRPDAVILAFGTNDLLTGATPHEVLVALMQLRQRARASGASVFVALTPPTWPAAREVNPKIDELNALLRETLPASRVLDFHAGFGATEFSDGIHLSDAGHERRAEVAAEQLRAAAPERP